MSLCCMFRSAKCRLIIIPSSRFYFCLKFILYLRNFPLPPQETIWFLFLDVGRLIESLTHSAPLWTALSLFQAGRPIGSHTTEVIVKEQSQNQHNYHFQILWNCINTAHFSAGTYFTQSRLVASGITKCAWILSCVYFHCINTLCWIYLIIQSRDLQFPKTTN